VALVSFSLRGIAQTFALMLCMDLEKIDLNSRCGTTDFLALEASLQL